MRDVVAIGILPFSLIYLLLILVLGVMKFCHLGQSKLLLLASVRMTVQLILAGFVLSYIFENPHPAFLFAYLALMCGFSIFRVLSKHRDLNTRFRWIIAGSIALPGLAVTSFFICVVVGESMLSAQYVIPVAGMIMGNTMTGASLGLKSFQEGLRSQRARMEALLYLGASPKRILLPVVRQAMETALLPTLNSMLGMGIVALPGMMTGQMLSGTLPSTAILYQIAIMVAICTVVTLSCFGALYFGYQTLYNKRNQFLF